MCAVLYHHHVCEYFSSAALKLNIAQSSQTSSPSPSTTVSSIISLDRAACARNFALQNNANKIKDI